MNPLKSLSPAFHGESPHFPEVIVTLIAGLSGLAKYIHEGMKHRKPFKWIEALGKFFVSAMVGVIVYHMLLSQDMDDNMIAACVGIFGWLGADGVELLIQYMKSKFFPKA